MKKKLYQQLLKEANKLKGELTSLRRHFHMYPEPGGQEIRTAAKIVKELQKLDIRVETKIGGTGLVGYLEKSGGKKSGGKYVALRADMDALSVQEENKVPYRSTVPGVGHLCGHDAHMAILLCTAKILAAHRHELRRGVKFVFQPCEEKPPGGARDMIVDGALKDVEEIFGLHVFSTIPFGVVCTKPGALMAASDLFEIKIIGKGGHAAMPHLSKDPVPVAAEVVTALQAIVSRETNPIESAVITIGAIAGGAIHNVIPDEVIMKGTVRTLNETMRREIPRAMVRRIKGIVDSAGMKYDFRYVRGYPVLNNHASSAEKAASIAKEIFGEKKLDYPCTPLMTGEDFAYYVQKVPGVFVFLGAALKQGHFPHHNPCFRIDEKILPLGTAYMAALALDS